MAWVVIVLLLQDFSNGYSRHKMRLDNRVASQVSNLMYQLSPSFLMLQKYAIYRAIQWTKESCCNDNFVKNLISKRSVHYSRVVNHIVLQIIHYTVRTTAL